jgi:hypothetical protein
MVWIWVVSSASAPWQKVPEGANIVLKCVWLELI